MLSFNGPNPKPDQALTGRLRSWAEKQSVFVVCGPKRHARLGKMLIELAIYA